MCSSVECRRQDARGAPRRRPFPYRQRTNLSAAPDRETRRKSTPLPVKSRSLGSCPEGQSRSTQDPSTADAAGCGRTRVAYDRSAWPSPILGARSFWALALSASPGQSRSRGGAVRRAAFSRSPTAGKPLARIDAAAGAKQRSRARKAARCGRLPPTLPNNRRLRELISEPASSKPSHSGSPRMPRVGGRTGDREVRKGS